MYCQLRIYYTYVSLFPILFIAPAEIRTPASPVRSLVYASIDYST